MVDATEQTLADGTATGFSFEDYTSLELAATLERACRAYADPVAWSQLVETGMQQDWSWAHSAEQYGVLYERTLHRAAHGGRL